MKKIIISVSVVFAIAIAIVGAYALFGDSDKDAAAKNSQIAVSDEQPTESVASASDSSSAPSFLKSAKEEIEEIEKATEEASVPEETTEKEIPEKPSAKPAAPVVAESTPAPVETEPEPVPVEPEPAPTEPAPAPEPEPVVEQPAPAGPNSVVVSISSQHVWLYDGYGNLISESDCITGKPGVSDTPTGSWVAHRKRSHYNLNGNPATPTSHAVFFNGLVGLHDADGWQTEYGGTRYLDGYGSHGCVNVPSWFAEVVYNNSTIGSTVFTVNP